MSDDAAPTSPDRALHADPGRQAVASLAGYSYQLWHSLLAWLTLPFGARLQLEGNEDIDLLRGDDAFTTQVKRVSKSLTLRSPDAVEAINNFWSAKGRNPEIKLTFRFLSTAEIGRETGDHFGGRMGLAVWQDAQRGADREADERAALQVRAFLLTLTTVSGDLRAWLTNASAGEVLTALIKPMDWHLGTVGTAEVRILVEEELVQLGEPFGIFPSNARRAAPFLLDKILATVTDPNDRFLDRIGLLDTFEKATSVTVPASGAGLMQQFARSASAPARTAENAAVIAVEAAARDGLPELPSTILHRENLVSAVVAKQAEGFICLYGSTGMGKSTLATLTALRMEQPPLWLDLRGASDQQHAVIRAAVAFFLKTRSLRALVLDDLSFSDDSRVLEDAIATAVAAARALQGTILITSATELPATLLLRLQLTGEHQIKIPELEEAEIRQLLLTYGLVDAAARTRWAQLIRLQTQGHPQLVDARVQSLAQRGFPSMGPDELQIVPDEIQEVRAQARRLIASLPPAQRDLLYRLSLSATFFRREAAIRIASLRPPIGAPGDVLDALAGPWIERIHGGRYRVSPLAVTAGRDANGEDWAVNTHHEIASRLLRGRLDQFDVVAICSHAVLGRNGQALTKVCVSLMMNSERLSDIAGMLAWLIYVDPMAAEFHLDRKSVAAVRLAQFDIAAHLDQEIMLYAATALETCTRLGPEANTPERTTRVVAALKLLMKTEVYLPASLIVSLAAELVELQASEPAFTETVRGFQASKRHAPPFESDLGSLLATFLPGRLKSVEDLRALWAALGDLPAGVRDELLTPFTQYPSLAQFVTDAVWLQQLNVESPAWEVLVSVLLEGYETTSAYNAIGLAAAAVVTAMRITNENLRLHRRALELGRTAVRQLGNDSRVLDAIADVLDTVGRPRAAYLLRAQVLLSWQPTILDVLGPALVRRKVARSAARSGDWKAAARYLSDAAVLVRNEDDQVVFRAGLLADAGHAAARAGDRPASIEFLVSSFELLLTVPNDPSNRRAFRLHKLFGNLITWLVEGTQKNPDGTGVFEPLPATCSDFEIAKDMSDLSPTPLEYSALNLCRYAGEAIETDQRLQNILDWIKSTPFVVVRSLASRVAVERGVANADLLATVNAAADHARELVFANQFKSAPDILFKQEETPTNLQVPEAALNELIKGPALSCLVHIVARHGWPISATQLPHEALLPDISSDLSQWLRSISDLPSTSYTQRWSSFLDARNNGDKYSALCFAISLSDDKEVPNEWIAHSHATIIQAARNRTLYSVCDAYISSIFVRRWSAIARQSFRLSYPRLTLPGLVAALQSDAAGLSKAAQLLLAGLPAVGVSMPKWLRDLLSEAAEK